MPKDIYYPIIYVRGFAASATEQNETAADPFCGFNLGSTVYRAMPDPKAPPKKFVFVSPIIRLGSDYGYKDVYDNGLDILDPGWTGPGNTDPANAKLPRKSIIIHRYYDEGSTLVGTGETPPIEHFASKLNELILKVRDLVCRGEDGIPGGMTSQTFKCYLLAHSMGGLIVRAFLQNPNLGAPEARSSVDKVFTYATPHNGIDMAGINVPGFLGVMDVKNFNRDRMAEYLNLGPLYAGKNDSRADLLPESIFPSKKFFCMIGTNRSDYEVAWGLSRTFVGHGSDGLVRIENASVTGVDDNGNLSPEPAPRAYCYRSHSGFFGIVNSEEAYQNVSRFLFGTNRADVWVQVDKVQLPPTLQAQKDAAAAAQNDFDVDAAYQFEILASPKGRPWYLTRRISEEDSVAVRSYKDLTSGNPENQKVFLSTIFLDKKARLDPNVPYLTFQVVLGIRVPDYVVEKKFWFDEHFEGSYLYRENFVFQVGPPDLTGNLNWEFKCRRVTDPPDTWPVQPKVTNEPDRMLIEIPFANTSIEGSLQIYASPWNV